MGKPNIRSNEGRIKFKYNVRVEFKFPPIPNNLESNPLLLVGDNEYEKEFILAYRKKVKPRIPNFEWKKEHYCSDIEVDAFCEISPKLEYGSRFLVICSPDIGTPFLHQMLYQPRRIHRYGPSLFYLTEKVSKLIDSDSGDYDKDKVRQLASQLIRRQRVEVFINNDIPLRVETRQFNVSNFHPYNPVSMSQLKTEKDIEFNPNHITTVAEVNNNIESSSLYSQSYSSRGNNKHVHSLFDMLVKEPQLMHWIM